MIEMPNRNRNKDQNQNCVVEMPWILNKNRQFCCSSRGTKTKRERNGRTWHDKLSFCILRCTRWATRPIVYENGIKIQFYYRYLKFKRQPIYWYLYGRWALGHVSFAILIMYSLATQFFTFTCIDFPSMFFANFLRLRCLLLWIFISRIQIQR